MALITVQVQTMELLSSFNSLIWCHFGVGFYLRKHPFLASNNFWWSTLFRLITSLSQFRTRCSQSVYLQVTDFSQLSSFGNELETTTSSNLWENSENGPVQRTHIDHLISVRLIYRVWQSNQSLLDHHKKWFFHVYKFSRLYT